MAQYKYSAVIIILPVIKDETHITHLHAINILGYYKENARNLSLATTTVYVTDPVINYVY